MRPKLRKGLALWCGLSILVTCPWLFGDTQHAGSAERAAVSELPPPASIVQYFRDRFEVPETVKLNAELLHRSPYPHLYQTVVTADDGKQKLANEMFITDDSRCFVAGNIFALNGASNAEIIRCVRDAAKVPPAAEVTVGPFAETVFPDFLKSSVTVKDGTKVQTGEVFVTRDRRTGILGLVLPFRRDFVQQLIDTRDQPSVGPAHARVTIVEYADLECPGCAFFQKFLENEFLPKYGSKVRIVFKELPLRGHAWSATAAVANECAYLIDPLKFLNYRTLIFGNQGTINAANVRERLLGLGEQAGLDRVRLGSCLDSRASLGRVEACLQEARNLGVIKTPTFCVNGRIIVGVPSAAAFCKIVDEAMAGN
jgi:protein-disulfide isomerase